MLILPNRFLSLQILRMGKTHRFVFTVHFKATTWSRKRRIIIDFTVRSNSLAVQHIFSRIEQLLKGNYNKCGHVLPLSHLICFQLCVFVCVVQQSVSVSGFCVFSHWNFTASMWKPTHTHTHPWFYSILTSCHISWQDWRPPIKHTSSRLFHMWK